MRRERLKNIQSTILKKPDYIRVTSANSKEYLETYEIVKKHNLHTVCQEAACPNIGECWKKQHATVMILGDICTRSCRFCNVKTGKPNILDENEPENVGKMANLMNLKHIVITSVDRDDLIDGGASHFHKTITKVKEYSSNTTIEVLTPDFRDKENALETVLSANPDVFNHNLETAPRLYREIRPKARYFNSLNLLWQAKNIKKNIFTKSGIMVGLGETKEEVLQIMDDLISAKVDFMTIGQYLQPTPFHAKVDRFVSLEEFDFYKQEGLKKGFLLVSSSPLTRSSYHADEDFKSLVAKRNQANN